MPDDKDREMSIFELYLGTAEKVSDRRAQANTWMLSVNSAVVALYGVLQADKTPVSTLQRPLWLWAIPLAGMIVSIAWVSLLTSYRKLNRAKFGVLEEIETRLAITPFKREQELYKADNRRSLSDVEILIPIGFIILYIFLLSANLAK
jgi:hypothetical protein